MFFLIPLLFCSILTYAQIKLPLAPAKVLQDRASQLAIQKGSTACDEACATLASHFPSSVFLAKTGNFDFWDTKQSELTPACRIEPSSSEEVSLVLETVIHTKCHFAIKSGGHDRTPGSSNADGGVTIDLVRLDGVDIAQDEKSVNIGAGLRWLDVYTALERKKLMVVGGRVSDVGLGGISFYSNRYGWACDNVLSYEIVLPNTSIQTVTQSSQPDLYRSLRGAGASNFGIVTAFTLEAFPQPNTVGIWGGPKIFGWDKVPKLLKLNYRLSNESMDLDQDVAIIHAFAYAQVYDVWWAVPNFRHTTHTDLSTWPKAFQPYEEVQGVPNTTNIAIKPLSNITIEMAGSTPSGDRTIYGTFTYHPSVEFEQKLLNLFQSYANSIKNTSEFLPAAVLQPISRNILRQMHKRGGNTLGLADHPGPLNIFHANWKWKHAADDARSYEVYYAFMAEAEAMAKEMGVWNPYKYINYSEATQDVFTGYGPENLRVLRKLQRKLDPEGVFAKGGLGGGYFKLNDMPGYAGEEEKEEEEKEEEGKEYGGKRDHEPKTEL